MEYKVQWRYTSSLGGPWEKGQVVELEEALAEAINRDSPGVLVSTAPAAPLDTLLRTVEEAPQDRMVKQAPKRKGA